SYLFSLFHHSRSHSRHLHSFPTRRSSDLAIEAMRVGAFDYITKPLDLRHVEAAVGRALEHQQLLQDKRKYENHLEELVRERTARSEEHTSELQLPDHLVCRLLLEKKKKAQ